MSLLFIRPPAKATTPHADEVAKHVCALLEVAARDIAEVEDPAQRVRQVEELVSRVLRGLDGLRTQSPSAVRALRRQGMTFGEIAQATDLPSHRIVELARQSRAAACHRQRGH